MILGFLVGCVACDQSTHSRESKDQPVIDSNQALGTIGDSKRKCLNIVGGAPTEDYPYVGLLSVSGGKGICTGSFLSHNTMITASHCLSGKAKDGNVSYVKNPPKQLAVRSGVEMFKKGVKPLKVIFGNKAKATDAQNDERPLYGAGKDIAILIFPDHTAPATISILERDANARDSLSVVGYGSTQWVSKNQKDPTPESLPRRAGSNKLLLLNKDLRRGLEGQFEDEFYLLGGPAQSSGQKATRTALGAPGDSGGPLLINDTIVGVLVVGMKTPHEIKSNFGGSDAAAFYVKMQSEFTKSLIKKAEKEGARVDYTDDENKKQVVQQDSCS